MIIASFDNDNCNIVISHFQAKCIVEVLRQTNMIEIYHATEKIAKSGFATDSVQVNGEVTNFVTTLGKMTDQYKGKSTKELETEDAAPAKPAISAETVH